MTGSYINYEVINREIIGAEESVLVTVITPFFNNHNLRETIQSVLEQDYPRIEYIIADDASYDSAYAVNCAKELITDKYSDKFVSVKVQRQTSNVGTVKNINDALKQVHGEYVFFLAANDTFYAPTVLRNWTKFFISQKALVSTAKRIVCKDKKENVQSVLPLKQQRKDIQILEPRDLYAKLICGNFISGSCTAYKRECFETYGYFDENYKLLEDYPMVLRLSKHGVKIAFWDEIAIYYMLDGVSSPEKINVTIEKDFEKLIYDEAATHGNDAAKLVMQYRTERAQRVLFYELWNNKKYMKAILHNPKMVIREVKQYVSGIVLRKYIRYINFMKKYRKGGYDV